MDGPDLALPGMPLMCVCVCVYSHKRPWAGAWQGHWSRHVLISLSVCVCAWATLCICICVHVFVNASLLFQERFTDLYTTSGLNPDSYSWRLTLWQSSSKVEKLSALEVFGSFFAISLNTDVSLQGVTLQWSVKHLNHILMEKSLKFTLSLCGFRECGAKSEKLPQVMSHKFKNEKNRNMWSVSLPGLCSVLLVYRLEANGLRLHSCY